MENVFVFLRRYCFSIVFRVFPMFGVWWCRSTSDRSNFGMGKTTAPDVSVFFLTHKTLVGIGRVFSFSF